MEVAVKYHFHDRFKEMSTTTTLLKSSTIAHGLTAMFFTVNPTRLSKIREMTSKIPVPGASSANMVKKMPLQAIHKLRWGQIKIKNPLKTSLPFL